MARGKHFRLRGVLTIDRLKKNSVQGGRAKIATVPEAPFFLVFHIHSQILSFKASFKHLKSLRVRDSELALYDRPGGPRNPRRDYFDQIFGRMKIRNPSRDYFDQILFGRQSGRNSSGTSKSARGLFRPDFRRIQFTTAQAAHDTLPSFLVSQKKCSENINSVPLFHTTPQTINSVVAHALPQIRNVLVSKQLRTLPRARGVPSEAPARQLKCMKMMNRGDATGKAAFTAVERRLPLKMQPSLNPAK